MKAKIKFFIVMICSIIFIISCGEDNSSGDNSYRLIDTMGNTLKHVEPPENIIAYESIRVEHDDSGGAAALASILNYLFGYNLSESDANGELMFYGNYGQIQPPKFSFYDMKQYVVALNHNANGYTYSDLCSFKAFDSDEISSVLGASLLPIEIGTDRHFVVLQGYDNAYVYFSSPLIGKICFSYRDFCAVNYREVVFVVWQNGMSPLTKGNTMPLGNFKQIL